MDLATFVEPAKTRKVGDQIITLIAPAALKLQTTGPGAATLLNEGPAAGKVWTVTLRVEIKETDA